jgi:MerR family copper efflux transcriptional regulator
MRIGELARHAGVQATAVRFYERRGLLRGQRSSNGYRSFDAADVTRVRFIRKAQGLGFSLAEIAAVLAMSDGTLAVSPGALRRLAEAKLADLEARRNDLARLGRGIRTLLARGVREGSPCPVLHSLGSLQPQGAAKPTTRRRGR